MYEEDESGYAGIEGTFGFNAEIKKYFAMERHENASAITNILVPIQSPIIMARGGATTPEAQEVEALAREMTRSLSTSGDLPLAHGLTDEQIAILKQQEWQPAHGIQPFTCPWSSLKNPAPVSDTTIIIDRLRPIPTAPASPIKKTATMFKDANRPTMTSLKGSLNLDVRRRATLAKPQSPLKATVPRDPLGDFPMTS
ncbi:hypothetical protein BGZ90_002107, partial [Linnemannia elongata]